MSVGKIDELVDPAALAGLDALYQKLGITTQGMRDATAAAAAFNNEISNSRSLSDFTQASNKATEAMQGVKEAQIQVNTVQQQAVTATNQVADAVKAKVIAEADATAVLQKLGGSIEANIKLLIEQKIELGQVSEQLKIHQKAMGDSSAGQVKSIETTAQLTKQQLLLKEAIAQNTLTIRQQTKEQLAAEQSNNLYMAQLNQLIKLQNSLSVSERENTVYGKELQAQIDATRASVVSANEAQGKFNDNVGNYPGKAEAAIATTDKVGKSFDVTGRLAGVLTSRIFRMAASFLLITVALGAIEWLAKWISGLDYFTGRLDLAVQSLKNFNDIMKSSEADSGKQVGSLKILYDATQDVTLSMKDRLTAAQELQKLYPDQFDASKTQALLNGEEKKSYDELTQSIIENARADAAKVKIQEIESKIIDEQANKIKIRNARMNQLSGVKDDIVNGSVGGSAEAGGGTSTLDITTKDRQKELINQEADAAQHEADVTIKSYNDQIGIIEKVIGLKKLVTSVKGDGKPPKKGKDIADDDDISNAKAKLEYQKAVAKETLDNDKQSYAARLAALKVYVEKSNALIDLEKDAKNRKPGTTAKQKDTNNTVAATQKLDVNAFDNTEKLKIQKEAIKEFEALNKELYAETLDDLQQSLNTQKEAIDKNLADETAALTAQYLKNELSEKDYQKKLKLIRDDANIQRIQAELTSEQAVLGIQQGFQAAQAVTGLNLGAPTDKQVQGTKNKVSGLKTELTNANTQKSTDGATLTKADENKKLVDTIKDVESLQNDASQLVQANTEAEIALLEVKRQKVIENANTEIALINKSILSSKEKARQENIIRAQAKSQQEAIVEQENKIKEKQAKYNRAIAIAQIIENTAIGITQATGYGFLGIPLAAIVAALGAAELATVIATPLPKYEKGGKVSKSGPIITGEVGPELRIDPSGRLSLTAGVPNVSFAEAGTQIISNKELIKMIGKPDQINYVGGQQVSMKTVERLLKENNELQRENSKQKSRIGSKADNSWKLYTDNYFR